MKASLPATIVKKPSIPLKPITMPRLGNGLHPQGRQEFINAKSILWMRESMNAPIRLLLNQLKEFDYDTKALEIEYTGLRDLVGRYSDLADCMKNIADREPSFSFLHW